MIYFKIINHYAHTDDEIMKINQLQCDTYNGTSKSYLNFKSTDINIINNVWYSLENLLKHAGLRDDKISEIRTPKHLKAVYSYINNNSNKKYNLGYLDVYEIKDKGHEPINYTQNTGTYITRWAESSTLNVGYGTFINLNFGSATLNDSKDHYFIIHAGNPTSNYSNNPIIKWNGINSDISNDFRIYDSINDITCTTTHRTITVVFKDNYNNLSIYKNNLLLEKTNVKKNDNKNYTFNANDVLEFKKPTEPTEPVEPEKPNTPTVKYFVIPKIEHVTFTPAKIPENATTTVSVKADNGYTIEKIHFWVIDPDTGERLLDTDYKDGSIKFDLTEFDNDNIHLLLDNLKQSVVVVEPNTPVYYTLPTVSHVTFNPKQAELGKMTPITASVENGYTINSLAFSATNPNTGLNIFNSSYKDGIINLNLTNFTRNDKTIVDNLIKVSQDIKKIEYKDWLIPTATGITFTAGGVPITTVKLGSYKNIVLHLDDHYWWDDDQGKGLVLDDGTVLGVWNGKSTFGVDLEKYTDPEQLKTAHWQLNYRKVDFTDEHNQQIPLKLELTHCVSDTQSILENSEKTVTLTADNGYIFDDDIIYYYYDNDGGYYDKLTKKANKKNTISFDVYVGPYHDYQNAVKQDDYLPSIKAIATKPDIMPTGTKSLHIYEMRDGEINTFMNSLVQKFGVNGVETVDFTKYVNQVYRIPFNVPENLTTDITDIKVGKYKVDVNTKQINQDKLIIDAGNIKIEPHYHNTNDYSPIECVLYLPFTKEIDLNINDIINHTINIKYNIDLLNGETTIIVSNENNEIYTGQFNISTSLEFYGLYEDKLVNRLNSTYINDILQAYIKLIYNKPINNLVSYETMEHGVLKDYQGFTKISNIDLQGNYNYNELVEINTLLKQGVFINDITRD